MATTTLIKDNRSLCFLEWVSANRIAKSELGTHRVDYLAQVSCLVSKNGEAPSAQSDFVIRKALYGLWQTWAHKPKGRFYSFAFSAALADASLLYFYGQELGCELLESHTYWGGAKAKSRTISFAQFREMALESYGLRVLLAKKTNNKKVLDFLRATKYPLFHKATPIGLFMNSAQLVCGDRFSRADTKLVKALIAGLESSTDMTSFLRFLAQKKMV